MSSASDDTKLSFLGIFAHPDDEVFSCGGVMALNKLRHIRNILICTTKGEAGEISSPDLATSSNLGLVREQELIEAAALMGVDELHFLGYRDSGMVDSPDNLYPAAYCNADASAVVPRLVRFIRNVRPQVVMTFDPTGGYGHPDHLAVHRHTLAAFRAAADPAYGPGLGEAWQAQRLFYPTFRREAFEELAKDLKAQGITPPEWDTDEVEFTEQPVHATVDVSAVVGPKWQAFKSHRTQFGSENPFMRASEEVIYRMLSTEWFELALPETKPEQPLTDLFDGLIA